MDIQAVAFDVGNTLIHYKAPLSWSTFYRPALTEALEVCGAKADAVDLSAGEAILSRYNTRVNPRLEEVRAADIFAQILAQWQLPGQWLLPFCTAFFGYFQAEACCDPHTDYILLQLKRAGLKIGALTDVAYGMDNTMALADLAPIAGRFDLVLTSTDVGFRKPHSAGFRRLLTYFGLEPAQMLYVGDEEKDIAGARALGIPAALLCSQDSVPDYGQSLTLYALSDLLHYLEIE